MKESIELDELLDRGKIGVFTSGSRFLTTVVFSLKHIWDDTVKTAQVRGLTVRYNPTYMQSITEGNRIAVIAHEAWHVALGHSFRRGNRHHKKYNKAADYVDNQLLKDTNFELPSGALQDNKYRGLSTEEVYDLLPDEPDDKNQDPLANDIDFSPITKEEEKKIELDTTMILSKAVMASKTAGEGIGTIPKEAEVYLEERLKPKLPYKALLRRYVSRVTKSNYSWKKPNKRFFPDLILPSLHSHKIGLIANAIDTSCSLTPKGLNTHLSEVTNIQKIFKPKEMLIIDCDSRIHNIHKVNERTSIKDLKFSGRGGTNFDPVIEYLNGLKELPLILIYYTDLWAPPLQVKPKYPVLWVCNSDHEPHPIGKTIYIKEG